MTHTSQFRYLTLNYNEKNDTSIYRLQQGWTLQFVLGASLADKHVRLFTNHPIKKDMGPQRHNYHELMWENLTSLKLDVYDNFAECYLIVAGSFNYYFTVNGSDSLQDANGSGFFLVDPILHCGPMDDRIMLDSIRCQTVVSKLLGPLEEWEGRLRVAVESGYNMIHFTPVQELGNSNSAYCLKDQLKLNPSFSSKGKISTMVDLQKLIEKMKTEWGVLSLTDLVYNHTANESPWLMEHPECSYNLVNSPHLKPAYVVDRILWHFGIDVAAGRFTDQGLPPQVKTEGHLQCAKDLLANRIFPKHRLDEFFIVDIDDIIARFRAALLGGLRADDTPLQNIVIENDPHYRRLKSTINFRAAVKLFYSNQSLNRSKDARIEDACASLRHVLVDLNQTTSATIAGHISCAIDNFIANARWRFIDKNGPKLDCVTVKQPLMWNYFTLPKNTSMVEEEEKLMDGPSGSYCMAHNGWVMNDDPLRNFAEKGSNIFLRRELIPWGDNVKLRYGSEPADCPFLWDYMKKYTIESATIFHGVRLDNCHSTPITVAEFMLDEARKVRPDLYVIAELFTSSEQMDNIFINRLGLNSLIREGLNAHSPRDLGRLVHRFGGFPVGSFMQPPHRPLVSSMAHAIFFDQTHDNQSPIEIHSVYDILPTSALISMACCATGSNRGCDEFIPHHINVVSEKRYYRSWASESIQSPSLVTSSDGAICAKAVINKLHDELTRTGFEQIFVDQITDDVCVVTRHNPISHDSIIMVARNAFSDCGTDCKNAVPHIMIPGHITEIILESKTMMSDVKEFEASLDFINGLDNYHTILHEKVQPSQSKFLKITNATPDQQRVDFIDFSPGTVAVFRVSLSTHIKASLLSVRQLLGQFGYQMRTFSARNVEDIRGGEVAVAVSKLTLNDLNTILYRCDQEERDDGFNYSSYYIPHYGNLIYCGLQGIMSILNKIRANNDLGHPLCDNLRSGNWLMKYTAERLIARKTTEEIGKWLSAAFEKLDCIPRYLIPCYFDAIVTGVASIAEEISWSKMSQFVKSGSMFVKHLSLGSIQMCSHIKTAPLPPLIERNNKLSSNEYNQDSSTNVALSLAAGLPHFCSGLFRNWGRDTFIAMRGLLLVTGRYEDARLLILAYGGCLRHGLIPNLLGAGSAARYNCRDAVWFFLHCIQEYCKMTKTTSILNDKVIRLYPTDEDDLHTNKEQPLQEIVQEALQRHASGVIFRERNAGPKIDEHMTSEGFNNAIGVDWNTGFIFGGNRHNCGTWMDKMGSSSKAGNKGVPATPRDGSAVELQGLCASILKWLSALYEHQQYPYSGVKVVIDGFERQMTFIEWYNMMKQNFEKHFFIPSILSSSDYLPELINRRGIYKDSINSQLPWTDFQLRPNFPIAFCADPDLVNNDNAWLALEIVEKTLMGPLGIKTLDPSDFQYNGDYINSCDSNDYKTAKGFNYHQGPEWLWPVGYFLRAKLIVAARLNHSRPGIWQTTVNYVKMIMTNHRKHLFESDWKSLPELTNSGGNKCEDSCMAQAWSVGCLLEVLYDMEQISLLLDQNE